ncbi:hypothetical protein [Aquabacterium sp.]|uniref:hypothetical protein n=1 Tax=Aquabacterium sp. TaxID=1872578 RepID=UPI003783D6C0
MEPLWPWLALAGLGALHGLNPTSGWPLLALVEGRSPQRSALLRALMRALVPLALGHVLSVALVAGLVAFGPAFVPSLGPVLDRGLLQWPAAGVLLLLAWRHGRRHGRCALRVPAGPAGLALSSFIAASAQGAGLMLVPALVPLCLSDSPARAITASGSVLLSLAALAVHLGAMLAVSALLAMGGRALLLATMFRLGQR